MRLNYLRLAPGVREAMLALSRLPGSEGLEPLLLELVKTRCSQLNRCAYCLDMHTREARSLGEDQRRIDLLPAWRETTFYSERERAALAWCEALTRLPLAEVADADFEALAVVFAPEEMVALTAEIVAINGWNRFEGAFRSPLRALERQAAEAPPAAAPPAAAP